MKKKVKDITIIRPIPIKKQHCLPVKGADLIPAPESTVGLFAKTNSGKTTIINHLIRHTIDKRTTVVIFCATVDLDPGWEAITKYLSRQKIKCITYNTLEEEGISLLDMLMRAIAEKKENEKLKREQEEHDKKFGKPPKPVHPLCLFDSTPQETKEQIEQKEVLKLERYKKKCKDSVPDYLVILDDISKEQFRGNALVNCLKQCRHFKMRVLMSTQHLTHVMPDAYNQMSQILVWSGFAQNHMKSLYEKLRNDGMSFEDFWKMYLDMTKEKYSFMNINMKDGSIRKKFGPKVN